MQWAAQMRRDWNVDVVTEEMARKVGRYLEKWNLSPLRHESYNKVRRAFSFLGEFRDGGGSVLDFGLPQTS